MKAKQIEWVAYCFTCQKEIDRAANGAWVESAAKCHQRQIIEDRLAAGNFVCAAEPYHRVIVGYEV
jgi:hypothetical protein